MSGTVTRLPTADEKAWAFIEWLAADGDCDCECDHDEGEPHTTSCRQCMWCQARDLVALHAVVPSTRAPSHSAEDGS